MNQQEFNKLQSVQLEIMDEVHRVCCEHNITYYIIGGTALGAVRHKGFIPWDVDIDIAMPRVDYERFAHSCQTVLSDRFVYRDYKNTHNFVHPHALVCIKNTFLSTRHEYLNSHEENLGIYLDVFPLDVAPENPVLQHKQAEDIKRIKWLQYYRRAYLYDNKFLRNTMKKLLATFIGFFYSIDKLNAMLDAVFRRYENIESSLWCSMSSHYSYEKQCMSSSVYGKAQLVKFENREFYAPEQLDEYLTRIFKNYMELPPESERQANLALFDKVIFDD